MDLWITQRFHQRLLHMWKNLHVKPKPLNGLATLGYFNMMSNLEMKQTAYAFGLSVQQALEHIFEQLWRGGD